VRPRYSDIQISGSVKEKKAKEEDPWIYKEAMPVAQCLAVLGRFSSDDIADRVSAPERPAKVGSLFGILQGKGLIKEVDMDQKFYSRHHSRIAMYQGTKTNRLAFRKMVRDGLKLDGINRDIFYKALIELGMEAPKRRLVRIGGNNGNQEEGTIRRQAGDTLRQEG
jgi:hypothetical protein